MQSSQLKNGRPAFEKWQHSGHDDDDKRCIESKFNHQNKEVKTVEPEIPSWCLNLIYNVVHVQVAD